LHLSETVAMKVAFLTTDNREHLKDYHCSVPYFGTAPEALLQGFAGKAGLEVHVVCCTQKPMQSPEKIAGNIWYHSLHVPKIGWMRTAYQGCIRAVRRKLRELGPDLAHGQGTERDCAISAVFSGFPSVVTIHGNMRLIARINRATLFSYMGLAAQLEGFTIPRANGIVCISRYTQNAIPDLTKKTWIVPNAVDQSFFDVKRAPHPEPVILCVGHIILRKNQNAFIRALDPLASQMRFKVCFLGQVSAQDPYSTEFLELIKMRPWCEYEGVASRDVLKGWLSTAHFLAMPSLEENCPMVLLEAMAAGVPIVAARVGGVPDLVEEDLNGTFCDPTNLESIRDAVRHVLENPGRAQAMSETAKRLALERYHPEVVARRHVEIYKEVVS
jgi:glycosyltransferase involved in cell wall biosynthesis